MKRLKFHRAIVAIAMMLIVGFSANAHDFVSGGIYYNITSSSSKRVKVTYCGDHYYTYDNEYSGIVVIPESVIYNNVEYSVTSIGNHAFDDCSGLTSIEIPNSVTSIGDGAFFSCSGLTSIEIPNSVTSIGRSAFNSCSGLTSIEIPNSVTSIGYGAFYYCDGLTSIEIPNSVTSIGDYTFYNCYSLTSATIGNSVTSIGDYAFYNCYSLTNIEIPNSVTSIGESAFYYCYSLTNIEIPNSVTSIGESAFYYCSRLTSVYINDLESYCNIEFANESANPVYYAKNLYLNGSLIEDLVIPEGVAKISDYLFYRLNHIKTVTIPNSVTSIGDYAFDDCYGLTSVTIGNSVTSIGDYAFSGCSGLTNIEIPNSVTSIGEYAFFLCSGLTSIEIPNSVTSIGNSAFSRCSGLTSIEIPNSVTSIGDGAFSGCSGLTSIEIPNSVTSIGNSAFSGCSGLTSIEIPNSVTSIGNSAFSDCLGLTSIEIPNSVTSIGNSAFFRCSGLTSIEIPNSVTSIGEYTFYLCSGLTSIEIPNSVTSIGNSAFYDCYGLTSVTIGNSVTSIGHMAFSDCLGLTSVVWNAIKCNDFAYNSGNYGPFYDSRKNITSFTFGDSVEHIPAYLCYYMSKLTSIEIPNSVTSIGNSAFYYCSGLTSIEIPNSVTSIGDYAFYYCSGLTSVTIGNSVTSIGYFAFSGCSGLTSVVWNAINCTYSSGSSPFSDSAANITSFTFGDAVQHIPKSLCYKMSKLTSIEIPNSVTSIGDFAFYYCSGLTSIEIPNSVTSIGDYAFADCSGLTEITCSAKFPPVIYSNTFYNVKKNIPLNVEKESKAVYEIANYWKDFNNIFEDGMIGQTFTFDGLVYEITKKETEVAVIGFKNNIDLGDIVIPEYALSFFQTKYKVTSIGNSAFYGCSGLTSIDIPNSVTSIGNSAFSRCSGLTSIEIPNSVTSIGEEAFYNCSGLTSVTIGNSVTSIGDYAFFCCSGLTSIEIPNSVTSIGDDAFYYCDGLTSIEIPNSVTSIGNYAFSGCSGLTSIEIPNSVTSIGNYAFSGCSGLTSVVWNAIKCNDFAYNYSGKYGPFYDSRENITSFTFGDSVEHIPAYLCYYMSKLTSITIPNSVTSIGNDTFHNCLGLTSVVWNAIKCNDFAYNSGKYGPFYDSRENITSFTFGDAVQHIPRYLCVNMSKLTSIEIPNSVTSIGSYAFNGCSGLTSVVWNAIDCNDFSKASNAPFYSISGNITSFTFGDAVQHIPAYLCYEMSKLTSIEIPNSVTSIGNGAFKDCSKLTIITLGNSLLSIGEDAFKECNNIKKIESKATKAPTIENEDQFSENVYANADLFVPLGYEDNYKYAYGWSEFNNIIGKDFTIRATSIALDKTEVTLKQSESVALTETILPYETSNKTVIWSTSDESVATVDANGLVTAIAVGEASITATTIDGSNLSATCKVIVEPTLAESIVLDNSEVTLKASETAELRVTILPELTTDKSVVWSTSDESVATVDANGVVTAIALGEAVITATTTDGSNLLVTCKVTVVPTLAETITLDKTEISIEATETATLVATVLPELTTDKSVVWSTSDESVATVDANGLVTAISVGEADITATTVDGSNLSASCKVTVIPTLVESITLDKTEISLEATETATLIAIVLPELATDKSVEWSSSDESVAVVDENGVVTAIAVGEATITATTTDGSNLSVSCKVTVVPTLVESIALDKTEITLEAMQTAELIATILPEHTTDKSVVWTSSDENVAIVDENGLVTAIAVGETDITATTTDGSNLSAFCKVIVVPTLATSIELDKTEISLEATETATLVASVLPELTTDKSVKWSSSDETVVVVDENGVVTAVAVGEATITATTADGSNLTATCKVTVVPTLATSIELDKAEISLEATETTTLVATVLPELTTNKSVTWTSSNEAVATVDANGVVTAIAVGEATITATTNDGTNLSASCKVTVVPTLATSIELDKTEISLEATETATLVATVLPELTTNKSVTWTSSNEAVATVDANGVVTAIALGEAVITATTTDGTNLSATCKVTVVPTLVVSIEVTPNSVEAEENSEVQLSVNILPENATYKSVEWTSSNDAIASVNANGLVKIRKEGNVVITATTTDGTNLSATCSINVYSGIDGVNGDNVIVATIGDNIVVKNAKLGSNVRVYAADGSIITSEIATDGDVVVEAPVKGIYVVAIDGKSFKVMVK